MGRGVSSGGGQSSLGYLFGGGEAPNPAAKTSVEAPKPTTNTSEPPKSQGEPASNEAPQKSTIAALPAGPGKQIPAGVPGSTANNYYRAEGQNCGNFITDRPTTKVHAAPGGGSSLDYLFGGGDSK